MINRNTIVNIDELLYKISEADTDNFAELCSIAGVNPLKELQGGDLRKTDLNKINLEGAVLSHSDLRKSSLVGANLKMADLSNSDLRGADLSDSDLRGANLRGANLRGANLRRVNLIKVDLTGADLKNAELEGAYLAGATITEGQIDGKNSVGLETDASASIPPKHPVTKTIENEEEVSIIKLNGRLDSNTSQEFEKEVNQAIFDGSRKIVVDFSDLDYISSAGLRVILKATKAIKRKEGKIRLCAMRHDVQEIFEIVGFGANFMPISKNLKEAVETLKKSS